MQSTFPQLRRLKLSAFALALVLLIPALAPASGATGKYAGTVNGDPDATVRFEVSRHHGKLKIRRKARWKALDAVCDGKVTPIKSKFSVTAKVSKKGVFRVDATDSTESEVYLEGTIADDGTASGTLRLRTAVLFDDEPRDCDSGVKEWDAELVQSLDTN